jgi:hypothetical protein
MSFFSVYSFFFDSGQKTKTNSVKKVFFNKKSL